MELILVAAPPRCAFAPSSFAFGYGVTGRVLCVKSFASMADESFKEFVLDQLSALPDVRTGHVMFRRVSSKL
jgi:hypothetical protein